METNGQYGRMNGEISSGSVPVTTLAGIASLTHLLPELPLPGPLPVAGAGGNSSLLFHPRVADEATRVLHTPDPDLARRLAQAISSTATGYNIEVLDPAHALPPQPTAPLAAAVLQLIPDLFGQNFGNHAPQQRNHAPPPVPQPTNHAHLNSYPGNFNQQQQQSPSSFGNSSTGSGYPDQSPAGSQQSGYGFGYGSQVNNFVNDQQLQHQQQGGGGNKVNNFSQNKPYPPNKNYVQQMGVGPVGPGVNNGENSVNSVDSIRTDQDIVNKTPVQNIQPVKGVEGIAMGGVVEQPRTNMNHVQSGVVNNGNSNGSSSSSRKSDLSSSLRAFRKDTLSKDKMAATTTTPAKESVIVSSPVKNDISEVKKDEVVVDSKQAKLDTRFFDVSASNGPSNFKKPMINMTKLSKEDNNLMQKHLKALKESPGSKKDVLENNYSSRAQRKKDAKYEEKEDSESSEDEDGEPKQKSKFFKHTEKERDDEKRRNRDDRRKRKLDDDYAPPENSEGSRKRKLDDDYVPETTAESGNWLKRRRKEEDVEKEDPDKPFVPKKVSRKIERKVDDKTKKLDPEALMESNTFQKFHKTAEMVFDNADDVDLKELEEAEDDAEIPPEILIPKHQAADLASEAAKLKSMEAMDQVPTERLVKLLNILSFNVKDGSKVIPLAENDDDEDDDSMWLEVASERVARSAECAVCALHIITSKNMSKRVYMEEVIDRITLFLRFHLQNTIYPSYDPVYKEMSKQEGYVGSAKKKRGYNHQVTNKNIKKLYNRCTEMVNLLSELLSIQALTDTTVLHLSSLGVGPFFVENIAELQLSSLKLVTAVFGKYDKHRRLVLDDILASIARLPSSKRSLRTYQLSGSEHIQMLTALVLQLIQCVVELPVRLAKKDDDKKDKKDKKEEEIVEIDPDIEVDRDVLVANKYENAMATAVQFLSVFLKKCGSKSEEIDYRPLFENFLQDLLTTVNTPEWPAAELLLSLLGKLLVSKFSNKATEVALRLTSLDYLGIVASRLRKDAVQSRLKIDTIDSIIASVKEAESEEGDVVNYDEKGLDEEEKRTRFLQRVLLDYLTVLKGEEDPMTYSARHFYISQWYRDANGEIKRQKGIDKPKRPKRKKRNNKNDSESEGEESGSEDDEKIDPANDSRMAEVFRLTEDRKDYLTAKILPFGDSKKKRGTSVISSHIDDKSALLIVKYLSSKRPFSNSFDIYLKQILSVLTEQSIQVRSKALKCMAMVVQEDPSVLSRDDMQRGVNYSFLDGSTMVREAAVDLVGKFILHKADLIDKYYDMMLKRILDTGVSVRKRVIKILRDICLEFPDYPKIPEICVRMIRRINDEEGIQKLVMDTFQNMWFVPVKDRNRSAKENHLLVLRAGNITDVVVACKDTGLEWFEQLLQTLFRPREDKDDATKVNREPPKHLVMACQQIVDCLCESVLKTEEDQLANEEEGRGGGKSHRIVACLTTMYLFAKSRPQLLVNHVQTLQPYLNVRCKTQGDYQIISNVAKTLELTVPLIEHPSEIFLSQLEEASIKLILLHDKAVVASCLSCLGSVVNNVTKNYKLIRDCFRKYFGHLNSYKKVHEADPKDPRLFKATPFFRRALFTVGLLLRHFDFTEKDLYRGLESRGETKMEVFMAMFYFLDHESKEIQNAALQAIGSLCIRHYELMLDERLKTRYIQILTKDESHVAHKIQNTALAMQVLNNIESYLNEEEVRMMKQDKKWKEYADKENLKEMGDVSSGMASTVIQVYLPSILDSYVHPSTQVRHAVLKCIQLVLLQGLVHPIQIVPYLICMSTDAEQRVAHTADHELQDIEKKYPGFIHMKLMHGVRLSYQLQMVLGKKENTDVVRGFRTKEGELPSALNGFLYSILKATKSQRRAILMNLLKQFDDTAHTPMSMLLYLADNLAYIPYTVIDEPLFLIHHIDIMVSVIGSNILENIKKLLKLPADYELKVTKTVIETENGPETVEKQEYIYDEDLDDDKESVLERLPDDMDPFMQNITTSQGCLLLLVLKEHLKELYGFNESKIEGYSPSEADKKVYERAVNRRVNVKFNPKATVHILKSKGMPPAEQLEEEDKKGLIDKYLGFKELMNKIDKDEDEYDEDGNLIPQEHNQLKPGEINSLGMPIFRPNVPTITLPPGIPGTPAQYAPSVNIQNISMSNLPANVSIPAGVTMNISRRPERRPEPPRGPTPEPIPESGGYLDPETGTWVEEKEEKRSGRGRDRDRDRDHDDRSSRSSRSDKAQAVTPLKITLKSNKNTQESPKVQDSPKIPKLKINVGGRGGQSGGLSMFDEMDKSAKERDERRGRKHHKPHKSDKHKKKKKKKYKSDSSNSDSDSEMECLD